MATNSNLLKIVELKDQSCHIVPGHKEIIMTVDYFHPWIATGAKDKVVKLWKILQ